MTDASNPSKSASPVISVADLWAQKSPAAKAVVGGGGFSLGRGTGSVNARRLNVNPLLQRVMPSWNPGAWKSRITHATGWAYRGTIPVLAKENAMFGRAPTMKDLTNLLVFGRIAHDARAYAAIQVCPPEWKHKEFDWKDPDNETKVKAYEAEVNRLLSVAELYVAASGTKEGLMKRLELVKRPKPKVQVKSELIDQALAGMGIDEKKLIDIRKLSMPSVTWVQLKFGSDIGAPWPAGRLREKEDIDAIKYVVDQILAAARADKLADLRKKKPEYFALRIKNKFEMMKVEDYFRKVRPYYVYGTPLTVLFGAVVRPIEMAMVPFYNDPSSHSAYKHVWSRGGTDNIMNFITGKMHRTESVFDWITFGDDQMVVCRLKNFKFVVCPDVSGMDMCLSISWSSVVARAYCKLYERNDKLDFAAAKIIHLYAEMLCRADVLYGSAAVVKTSGWNSGANGITTSEMLVLNVVYERVKDRVVAALQRYMEEKNLEVARAGVVEALKILYTEAESAGIFYKPDTQQVFEHTETEDVLDGKQTKWAFLGTHLRLQDGVWVPGWTDKVFASWCHPVIRGNKNLDGKKKARAFGLALAGGYLHPIVYNALRNVYNILDAGGVRMTAMEEVAGFPGFSDFLAEGYNQESGDPEFPTQAAIFNFYATPGAKLLDILEYEEEVVPGPPSSDEDVPPPPPPEDDMVLPPGPPKTLEGMMDFKHTHTAKISEKEAKDVKTATVSPPTSAGSAGAQPSVKKKSWADETELDDMRAVAESDVVPTLSKVEGGSTTQPHPVTAAEADQRHKAVLTKPPTRSRGRGGRKPGARKGTGVPQIDEESDIYETDEARAEEEDDFYEEDQELQRMLDKLNKT